ncbi:hypothetical protein FK531_15300 [Rhodococcus spelaei]|uniref:Biotin-protein ligase N-terminal domain-containing protein n=1 Tax=Rhodococcus spelaei TaxID=2546320 RepID=A0A541B830_9NOCA|nr:hypothetical protein FK531_15300 [Rhodococcus spelaei]
MALVYRGPASVPGCPESVAALLQSSPSRFRTAYVGPGERLEISPAVLATATVYAQPGGPSLSTAWQAMRPYADTLRSWIAGGGKYLGFCVGGYLAGATPGLNLLPGDTWRYISASDASVTTAAPSRITVNWRGVPQALYFQDGPVFQLNPGSGAAVLATYRGGQVAALTTRYGNGRVGVTGPHVEADASWFTDDGLDPTGAVHPDLGHDLIESTVNGL